MEPQDDYLLTSATRRKLNRLRRGIRAHWAAEALAWTVVTVAAVMVVTLACDWGLSRLTRRPVGLSLRYAAMVASLTAAAWIVWRRAGRWVPARWSDDELALLVQRRYPQLGDRLITAVQLAPRRRDDRSMVSASLVAETARQADAAVASLDFSAVLDHRQWLRRASMAIAASAVVVLLLIASPRTMHLWFVRNVMFADAPWPQETRLVLDGGTDRAVLRGGDLRVEVRCTPDSQVIPDEVVFHLTYLASGRANEVLRRTNGATGYVKVFRNVAEPFSFYATGHDGRTDVCRVRVVEPAEVSGVRCKVEYPGYMDRPARWFEGAQGSVSACPGSWVTVVAEATKDLSAARLMLDGAEVGEATIRPVSLNGSSDPAPGVVGRFQVPAGPAGRRVRTLQLTLTDREGHTNPQPYRLPIHVWHDQPPGIKADWLAAGRRITTRGVVGVSVDATDDCGLVSVAAETTVTDGSGEPADLPIRAFDPSRSAVTIARHRLDLAQIDLDVGDTVRITIIAADSRPVGAGGPNVRRSDTREFQVISEADLLAELLDQQKQMRLRMAQTLEAQAAARDLVRAAADQTGDEARRLVADGAGRQQTAATYAGTIAATYRSITQSLSDNRAGDPADREKMIRQIAEPLETLVVGPMLTVLTALDAAGENPAGELAAVAGEQDRLYRRLDAIMQSMVQLDSVQELARRLTGVIKVTEEVKRGIETRLEAKTDELFD